MQHPEGVHAQQNRRQRRQQQDAPSDGKMLAKRHAAGLSASAPIHPGDARHTRAGSPGTRSTIRSSSRCPGPTAAWERGSGTPGSSGSAFASGGTRTRGAESDGHGGEETRTRRKDAEPSPSAETWERERGGGGDGGNGAAEAEADAGATTEARGGDGAGGCADACCYTLIEDVRDKRRRSTGRPASAPLFAVSAAADPTVVRGISLCEEGMVRVLHRLAVKELRPQREVRSHVHRPRPRPHPLPLRPGRRWSLRPPHPLWDSLAAAKTSLPGRVRRDAAERSGTVTSPPLCRPRRTMARWRSATAHTWSHGPLRYTLTSRRLDVSDGPRVDVLEISRAEERIVAALDCLAAGAAIPMSEHAREMRERLELRSTCAARCGRLHQRHVSLLACGGCRRVRYCDAECQRAHWPAHREACRRARRSRNVRTPSVSTPAGWGRLRRRRYRWRCR